MQLRRKKRTTIQDSLDYVRSNLGKVRRLTADEEKDLARKAKAGDKEARDTLVECNVPLAIKAVYGWAKGSPARTELYLGAALEALIYGIDRFDPERGLKLSTYLGHTIRRRITLAWRNEGTLIRVPIHVHDSICAVASGNPLAPRRANLELVEVGRFALGQGALGTEGVEDGALNSVADPASLDRDDLPMGVTPRELHDAVDRLSARHAELIRARWLAAEVSQPRLLDIARRDGISKQRVQQIEQEAFAALRAILTGPEESTQERKEAA